MQIEGSVSILRLPFRKGEIKMYEDGAAVLQMKKVFLKAIHLLELILKVLENLCVLLAKKEEKLEII